MRAAFALDAEGVAAKVQHVVDERMALAQAAAKEEFIRWMAREQEAFMRWIDAHEIPEANAADRPVLH